MEDKVRAVMATALGVPPMAITAEASPDTLENWDSLHHMNLLVALEEEFEVEFEEEEISALLSFDTIVDVISKKKNCISNSI